MGVNIIIYTINVEVNKMSKPIQPSPTLDEEMSEDFLKQMNKPPSKKIEHFKRIEKEFDRSRLHLKTDPDYKFPPILRNNGKIE